MAYDDTEDVGMTVFVICEIDSKPRAVFSTREQAEAYVDANPHLQGSGYTGEKYDAIYEFELDSTKEASE